MAIVFADGFDGYGSGDISKKWTFMTGGETIVTNPKRFGRASMCLGGSDWVYKSLIGSWATWVVGCGIYWTGGGSPIIKLMEDSTVHIDLRIGTGQRIVITRNGTVLATSAESIPLSKWFYIQLKVTCHDDTGAVEVKLDGETIINLSGIDTRNGATGYFNRIEIRQPGSTVYIDDLYIDDENFLGNVSIEAIYPNAAGTYTQWAPSTGNNYECVDEIPGSAADYVSSETADQIDTYGFSDVSGSAVIKGVIIHALAVKNDAGTRQIALVSRPGLIDHISATKTLTDDPMYHTHILENNPDTDAPWTPAELNAAEFGVKLVA